MALTSFHGSSCKRKLSRGFSLLPSLVVMLALSAFLCSFVAARRAKICSLEKSRRAFESHVDESNCKTESEWLNVAF